MDKLKRTEKRLRNVGGEKVRKVCPSVRTLYSAVSVTRHGKISPLWQNLKVFGQLMNLLWQIFYAIGQIYILINAQILKIV